MASANLELVRSIFAGWERGDFVGSTDWVDPEIEYVIADGPNPGRWTGLAGLWEGFRHFLSTWEELRVEVDEYRELDGERVLVLHHFSGRGKTRGLELGQMRPRTANLFQLRGDKVTRLVAYYDRERAFADLGLAPEAGSPGP
jgi:ketosteroid isomerase-like protein